MKDLSLPKIMYVLSVLIFASYLTMATAYAESEYEIAKRQSAARELEREAPLQQFRESNVSDPALCRFVNIAPQASQGTTTATPATLFEDVRAIYVSVDVFNQLDAEPPNTLDHMKIAQLAGCILAKHLTPLATTQERIPIYVPDRRASYAFWPEDQKDGNLIVHTAVRFHKLGLFSGDAVTVSVDYFRHDVHTIEDALHNCYETFPLSKNANDSWRALTETFERCLGREYKLPSSNLKGQ